MYIPETYIWDIPVDMTGKLIKVNSVEYTIRYLTIDEINNNSQVDLLQDSEYLEKLGETITNKIVDLNNETAFENNWSNDDIKENNEYFSKVSDYINLLWSEYKSKEFFSKLSKLVALSALKSTAVVPLNAK